MSERPTNDLRIAIIGAGPGGMCMGKRLLDEGFEDFVLLEKSDGVGGTWNLNRYPGCECDVQSALYSFSFEIKPDWTKPYGTQPEILEYMRHVAEKYGLLPHVRLNNGVVRAEWSDADARWTLTLEDGSTIAAEVVVSAIGMFNDLSWPDIEGLDAFAGTLFHSAQWDWDHDLTGERVAVIGSAASAVQFVPEIRKEAAMVHLFQRTANWVTPKVDTPYTDEQLESFRRDPTPILEFRREIEDSMNKGMTFTNAEKLAASEAAVHAAIDQVADPVVREKLRPQHPFGCKRPLMSNYYYPAFNEPNLELVTDHIARITPGGVVTEDGTERAVDTIILATGFAATKYLSAIDVVGRDGRTIDDAWNDGAQAYLGITTAGFPNLFMLYGPNTNNGSILTMIEYQVDHIIEHVKRLVAENLAWVDVRPEPMERFNAEVQEAIAGIPVWNYGCNGYYRTPSGRIVTQWPFSMTEFHDRTSTIDPADYEVSEGVG
ncbi:MAG: NAD(P)/FAD-dependent oxidoreductase [Acidimicrobiales bacterium]|nr:NAD(P)/FAD-dependent oxidoreductase [Acidimicrobiales bacterium]